MRIRKLEIGGPLAVLALAAACVPRTQPPAPVPEPQPAPAPAPVVVAPPRPAPDWREAPLSPGDWDLRRDGTLSAAVYGTAGRPELVVRCEGGARVSVARLGAAGAGPLVVRTTGGDRALPASNRGGDALVATVAASDPLLDQMVFSRGRFAVEAAGVPRLIVPAWPEPARVVEDCRD